MNSDSHQTNIKDTTMKQLVFSVLALFTISLLLLASTTAAEKKFEKSFNVSSGGLLTLRTDLGDISVEGTSSKEVRVLAVVTGSKRFTEEFEITAEASDNTVKVRGEMASKWRHWGSDDSNVKYTISVPLEFNLTLRTAGGDVVVSNIQGKVDGETSGGDIHALRVDGDVQLSTSGGDVEGKDLRGKLVLETSGGDIMIVKAEGSVDASTSGGDIQIADVEGKVRAETSGGNVAVRVSSSMKGIHAETMGGNVDITVPRNVAANIDASTFGGEVSCDLPVTLSGKISESSVRGTVNGGGETIHAHTMGGNISIRSK